MTSVILRPTAGGWWWGLLGVVAFSFTVPFTHVAVEGLPPLFVGAGRAVLAALLATIALAGTRQRLPRGPQWARLALVGAGIVVGFPMLTSFALTSAPAGHGAVVIALLPVATAVAVVVRTGEHPTRSFWGAAGLGALAAVGFAVVRSGGPGGLHASDLLLFAAVLCAAVGYAEGGMLAREIGSWQTVCWALVICCPLTGTLVLVSAGRGLPQGTTAAWLAFAYLGLVSMFLGFFAWYRGLAIGPMAQVSQVQLAQPVMSIAWAGLLLGEHVSAATAVGGLAVVACAAVAVRTRIRDPATAPPVRRETPPT